MKVKVMGNPIKCLICLHVHDSKETQGCLRLVPISKTLRLRT